MTTTSKGLSLSDRFKHLVGFRMDNSQDVDEEDDEFHSDNEEIEEPENNENTPDNGSKSKKAKAKQAKAEDDDTDAEDEGDDETDAEDEDDKETAKARARERGRCAAIIASATQSNLQQACCLAFETNISRDKAINILKTSLVTQKSSQNKIQKLHQRMASHRNHVSQITPIENKSASEEDKLVSQILACAEEIGIVDKG